MRGSHGCLPLWVDWTTLPPHSRRLLPALRTARELPRLLGLYHVTTGYLALLMGNPAKARTDYQAALPLFREAGNELSVLSCIGSFANVCWSTGDLDAAESAFREAIAMARSRSGSKALLGFALMHLAGVLTERGEIAEARQAACEGLPMLGDMGNAWRLMDYLALLAALGGNIEIAARVAGYADAAFAAKQIVRESNEARARSRLQAILHEHFDSTALDELFTEGGSMSEREACRLALET